MNFTPIEWIALVIAVLSLIKISTILISKETWLLGISERFYKHTVLSTTVFIVLAGIIFYYLIQYFTIVEIFAILGFSFLLIGIELMQESSEVIKVIRKVLRRNFTFGETLYIIIWTGLCLWVLYELFVV